MDDKNSTPAKTRFDVFVVENWKDAEGGDQANWIRVGVAFPHKDRKGFNIEVNALPVSGKFVIREHEPKSKA